MRSAVDQKRDGERGAMSPKWQHAHGTRGALEVPAAFPPAPRHGMRRQAGERKRAQPHHSDSLWSQGRFHLLPAAPKSAPFGPATDVPPTADPLRCSLAWRGFLDATTPLRDPCGSVAATSAILSFASDAHDGGAVAPLFTPLFPRSPERRRAEISLRALQIRALTCLPPAPTSSRIFHPTDFSWVSAPGKARVSPAPLASPPLTPVAR